MSFQRDFLSKKITDPLAKIVSDLAKQEYQETFQTQNIDSLNVQILSIKTKTKTLSKDKFHVSVKSYDSDQRFYNAVYPDRNKLKLWIKGENSDKLHDYSLLNHDAHLWSSYQVAEQYQRDDPDNMAGYETVSYANGTHYIHVAKTRDLNISDLIVDEPSSNGFTIIVRYNPLIYGSSVQDSVILEQKVDNSQNKYGHSVNVDNQGNIYFYVAFNYRLYFCKMNTPITIPIEFSDYAAINYKSKNYKTEVSNLEPAIDDSYDLVCQFNYSTKECSIKVLKDGIITHTASSLTGDTALPANIRINLPMQEGKWSSSRTLPNNLPMNQVFDSTNYQHIGTIDSSAACQWQEDNTLLFKATEDEVDSPNITIPNDAAFNTFTEMTLCYWYKPLAGNIHINRIFMIGESTTPHIRVHRSSNSNNIRFLLSLNADGTNEKSMTYDNAFPIYNQWYFVTIKWKSGEAMKISVNNGADQLDSEITTGTFTQLTSPFKIMSSRQDNAEIIHVMFFKRQLLAAEQTTLFNYGAHLAQFPTNLEPQRLQNPSPTSVTNPVTTIYDLPKIVSPVLTDYTFINNPATENPFIEKYDVNDGVAGNTALSDIYNIAAGTGGTTTNPFKTIYTLPGASSTGTIDEDQNEWGYGQYILDDSSDIEDQKVTEIQCWLAKDGATGGTVYLGILKDNADLDNSSSYIKFGSGISLSSLSGSWKSFTKQLLTNTYTMDVGDAVGVIWEGGTGGSILVRRGGSGNHYESESRQNHVDNNGWNQPNNDFSMAGTFKKGGDTVGTSPYYTLKNTSGNFIFMGEVFPSGSPMIGENPTRAEFRVYRDSNATNGTVSIRHVKANGTYYPTLYEVNVSTLLTTAPAIFNFVWEDLDYQNPILAGERIVVCVSGQTTGNVYVLSNIGNTTNNNYDGTRSYLTVKNFDNTYSGHTGYDIAGVIKKGGNTFTGFMKFSSSVTRIYERAVDVGSVFYDQPLTKIKTRGRRVGTIEDPSTITATLRSNSNVIKATFGTLDANSIGTTIQNIEFINSNNTVKVAVGDYVSIEIDTCDSNNYIELSISNVPYNAGNSLLGTLKSGIIGDLASYDLSGEFFTGGEIDNVSRPRVSQYIHTQDSLFLNVPNNRITSVTATLVKVGSPSGLVYFNIRRGFDDALIVSLGSTSASAITTALTGTTVTITNFNNTYILEAKDRISIEYEGGNPSSNIGVQIRTVTPNYDGTNSYIARYNGAVYDYITTKDLVSTMKVGGDTYLPDPNEPPPVLPENPKDLYILSNTKKEQSSFMRCIFGMYLFFNTLLTDNELLQFNITRIDTGNNLPNEIQTTNHSFFRNE